MEKNTLYLKKKVELTMANLDTLLEGYLKKRSKLPFRHWREYFFILQTFDLIYYKSHQKLDMPYGRIRLKEVNNISISQTKQNGCQIEIGSLKQGRLTTHFLLANNKRDANMWLVTLDELRQKTSTTTNQSDWMQTILLGKPTKEGHLKFSRSSANKIWKKPYKLAEVVSPPTRNQYEGYDIVKCQCYSPSGLATILLLIRGSELVKDVQEQVYSRLFPTKDGHAQDLVSKYSLRLGAMGVYELLPSEANLRMSDFMLFQKCIETGKMLVVQLLDAPQENLVLHEIQNTTSELSLELMNLATLYAHRTPTLVQNTASELSSELVDLETLYAHKTPTLYAQRTYLCVQVYEVLLKIPPTTPPKIRQSYCHMVLSLYHGAERLGKPYECSTSFIPHCASLRWNELLTFSLLHLDFPEILSINFALYHSFVIKSKEGTTLSKLLGWANLHMMQGSGQDIESSSRGNMKCLHLWPHEPIYSCGTVLESSSEECCGVLRVEVNHQNNKLNHTFWPKVNHPNTEFNHTLWENNSLEAQKMQSFQISPGATDIQALDNITDSKDVLATFDDSQRRVLWQFRDYLSQFPHALTKVLQAAQWDSQYCVHEVHRLLKCWQPPTSFQAIQLLGPEFGDLAVRLYATQCLELLSDEELSMVLMQLVQALQYEPSQSESPLSQFLVMRASSSWSLGQQFFWLVKTGMQTALFSFRFQSILASFLRLCPPNFQESFIQQENLVTNLKAIANNIKTTAKGKHGQQILETLLMDIQLSKHMILPIDPRSKVDYIEVGKCKYMKSKKLPLWLVFHKASAPQNSISIIFKAGDDLRQDMLTLQLLDMMQKIWWRTGLDLRMTVYKVIATGVNDGMLEVVENGETLSNISKFAGGGVACFKENTLANWLREQNTTAEQYNLAVDNFIRSCAGYCVASCVIGIGDRHNDNIMVKRNGELFHIDFGHILGNFKSKFGIERERARFIFTPDFAFVMGGIDDQRFKNFEFTCVRAFNKLRENASLLLNLMNLMVSAGLPQLQTPKHIYYMRDGLLLNHSENLAGEQFKKWLHESLHTKTAQINNAIHTWKHG